MSKCLFVGRALTLMVAAILCLCPHPLKAADWVVIAVTGMKPQVLAAAQVEEKEAMVILRNAQGIAIGAWQKEFVVARVAMLPVARESWTTEQITRQAGELEAFVAQNPVAAEPVNPSILEAREYLKQEAVKAAAREAERQAALRKRLEVVSSLAAPDRASPPELAELEAQVTEIQTLEKELPEKAAELGERLKSWIELRDAVAAGKKWFEDGWKTVKEIEAIQEARRQEAIALIREKAAKMDIPAVVLSAAIMGKIRIGVVASMVLGIFSLLMLLFVRTSHGITVPTSTRGHITIQHSGGIWEFFKITAILASLALMAVEGFYVYRLWFAQPTPPAEVADPATSAELSRMIYACSQPENLKPADVPAMVQVDEEALNRHLAKNLVFTQENEAGALLRTAWTVKVSPQAIVFLEDLQCDGHQWTANYEIKLKEDSQGIHFSTGAVTVDGMPVPNLLGGALWNSFQSEILQWAKKNQLDSHYRFAGIDQDKIKFKLTLTPAAHP